MRYRAKVKLHGSNCAIRVLNGAVSAQSRTQNLGLSAEGQQVDYKGFATWVTQQQDFFQKLPSLVVFGEWCGPGVEAGMAVSDLPTKIFAVFAVLEVDDKHKRIIFDPDQIRKALPNPLPAGMFVLPWQGDAFTIDFASESSVASSVTTLNQSVKEVEAVDPWVKSQFGISGLGEGLVFYPVDIPTEDDQFFTLMFKAKGEKHRTAGKGAVQSSATAATGVPEFVSQVVTEARLNQGAGVVGRDLRLMGKFIAWVCFDVQKETQAELEVSNLTWKQVEKTVQEAARNWYKVYCSN